MNEFAGGYAFSPARRIPMTVAEIKAKYGPSAEVAKCRDAAIRRERDSLLRQLELVEMLSGHRTAH